MILEISPDLNIDNCPGTCSKIRTDRGCKVTIHAGKLWPELVVVVVLVVIGLPVILVVVVLAVVALLIVVLVKGN